MDIISGIISLIKLVVGYLINVFVGRKNARNSQKLSNNEKAFKLKEQLKYLVELYDHNWRVFHGPKQRQEDIDSAIWETGLLIFKLNYKEYLSYAALTDTEKQKILSWMRQWEIIDQKIADYLSEHNCDRIVAETILRKNCMKQNEQLKKLLPDIKLIIQKIDKCIKDS